MQQDRFESSTSHTGSYSVQNHTNLPEESRTDENLECPPAGSRPLSHLERLWLQEEAAMDPKLTPLARQTLTMLSRHYNDARGDSYPSQALIARELSTSFQKVSKAIILLRSQGYVTAERRENHGRSLRYLLRLPSPPRLVRSSVPDSPSRASHARGSNSPSGASHSTPDSPSRASSPESNSPSRASHDSPSRASRTGIPGTGSTQAPSSPVVEAPSSPPPMPAPRQKSARAKPKHSLPDDWQPTDEMVQRCVKTKGLSEARVRHETEKFLNFFLGQPDKKWSDWGRCWWNWMLNVAPGGQFHRPEKAAAATEHHRAGNLGLARPLTQDEWKKRRH